MRIILRALFIIALTSQLAVGADGSLSANFGKLDAKFVSKIIVQDPPFEEMKSYLDKENAKSRLDKSFWLWLLYEGVSPAGANNSLERSSNLIEYALSMGADVNHKENNSASPLHWVVLNYKYHVDIAEILLINGADPTQRASQDNSTPLEYATSKNRQKLIDLLSGIDAEMVKAWNDARTKDSATAYRVFLNKYSSSFYAEQANKNLAITQKIEAREAKLSPSVRRDKYMLALSQLLKEQQFAKALPYFNKLEALQVEKDPSLDYYYGEALFRSGRTNKALEVLYRYITEQGSDAVNYTHALQLISEVETAI